MSTQGIKLRENAGKVHSFSLDGYLVAREGEKKGKGGTGHKSQTEQWDDGRYGRAVGKESGKDMYGYSRALSGRR